MERFNKRILLIIMLIGIFLLTGCSKFHFGTFKEANDGKSSTEITLAPENKNEKTSIGEEKDANTDSEVEGTIDSTPTPSLIQPIANIDLPIYTVNVNSGNIETRTALISKDSEITPELIVTTVIESMADQSLIVGIESVIAENDTVIVSFKKNQEPFSDMGAGYESAILDAIAQSITDNLDDYNKVIYRVEGKAYVSGHIELEVDEVYFEDN